MYRIYTAPCYFKMFLTYDVESSFIRKGFKREHTLLFEFAMFNDTISYQRMINPLSKYACADDIIGEFDKLGSDPLKSLRFWTKLLAEKGAISSSVRRKNRWDQAAAISKLLLRSDVALANKHPEKMLFALEQENDDRSKAMSLLETKRMLGKPSGPLFYKPNDVLRAAKTKGHGILWVAHNGKSFDEKILKGHDVDWKGTFFVDSLPLLRKLLPDKISYSQPLLFKDVFHRKYFAHHALDDAQALHKLLTHALDGKDLSTVLEENVKPKARDKTRAKRDSIDTDLTDLKGIGYSSAVVLMANKIQSIDDLTEYVRTHTYTDWVKTFSGVHHYKKFGERLFTKC